MLEDSELRVAAHLFQEYGKARGALAGRELGPALVDELVRVAPHPVPLEFRDRELVHADVGVSLRRQIRYRRLLLFFGNEIVRSIGKVSCAIALIKAGANLEAFSNPSQRTPLVLAVYSNRRIIPILLRAGARIDTCMNRIGNLSQNPYMPGTASRAIFVGKVDAAGGWKNWEKAHRKRLTATFAKAFPRLPVDAISHMVMFAFHVGFY